MCLCVSSVHVCFPSSLSSFPLPSYTLLSPPTFPSLFLNFSTPPPPSFAPSLFLFLYITLLSLPPPTSPPLLTTHFISDLPSLYHYLSSLCNHLSLFCNHFSSFSRHSRRVFFPRHPQHHPQHICRGRADRHTRGTYVLVIISISSRSNECTMVDRRIRSIKAIIIAGGRGLVCEELVMCPFVCLSLLIRLNYVKFL